MKTPEEIKKGLECGNNDIGCPICPYLGDTKCIQKRNADALALIQQLERDKNWVSENYNLILQQLERDKNWASENYDLIREENEQLKAQNAELLEKIKQLERERDALFEALRTNRHICNSCKHKPGHGYGCTSVAKVDGSCWEWRGLHEENGGKSND